MERLSGIIAPSLDLICTEGKSVKNIEEAKGSPSFGCITSISVFGKSKKMVPRDEPRNQPDPRPGSALGTVLGIHT